MRDVTVEFESQLPIGFRTDKPISEIIAMVSDPRNWKFGDVPKITNIIERR